MTAKGLAAAILCLGLAQTATAQTEATSVEAQYEAAFRAFVPPGFQGLDPEIAARAIAAMIPTLEGAWVRADALSGDSPFLGSDMLPRACEVLGARLVQTEPHGFELWTLGPDKEPRLKVRYDYAGQNLFQRSVGETEFLAYIGRTDDPELPIRILTGRPMGLVSLFHPGPDILVLHHHDGYNEIYARCP